MKMPQQTLPDEYTRMPLERVEERIARRKSELGDGLVILGHHYQHDAVIQFADFVGDSLKLSQLAARQRSARYIVFCGVHFMAESADILAGQDQCVCIPNPLAGCAMADLADGPEVAAALEEIARLTPSRVVPITYVNSTAVVKAITARGGGACCTSSNVRNVFAWALAPAAANGAGGEKIFAIPDQHLGRNTALAMGHRLEDCVVYDPALPCGGLTAEQVGSARFILWKGHCYVHQVFKPAHVRAVRESLPGVRVIVHPECPHEVVSLADASGSTEQIIRAVQTSAAGSRWAIGTEANLVNRLARQHPDKSIRLLGTAAAFCQQMGRITPAHLLHVLDNLAQGRVINQVEVAADVARDARRALDKMISINAVGDATPNAGG